MRLKLKTPALPAKRRGQRVVSYAKGKTIYCQGDRANHVFQVIRGKISFSVVSRQGKEAVIAVLNSGDFFGEGSLSGQATRHATATSLTDCSLLKIDKSAALRLLRNDRKFSDRFIAYILSRNIRIEEDLVDQLFNSSEKRLARILLLLSNFGHANKAAQVIPHVGQETLAKMVGTTRSRVNFFMNKFRRLGFLEYNGGLSVHHSLLSVVLHD